MALDFTTLTQRAHDVEHPVKTAASHAAQALHDDAYSVYKKVNANPIGHTAIEFGKGALHEVEQHPVQLAADVAIGAVAIAAIPEEGVAGLVILGVGAVSALGYGAYKAVDIARHEGIGAIPQHILKAGQDVVKLAQTEFDPSHHTPAERKAADAAVESAGQTLPRLAAGAVGGALGKPLKVAIKNAIAIGDQIGAVAWKALSSQHVWQEAPIGPADASALCGAR